MLPTVTGPYSNTLQDLDIPSGSTLKITSKIGNLTSYTQQFEEQDRVSIVATPDSMNGKATPKFMPNAHFPVLSTVVDGVLDAGRVEIVDGLLSGTGKVMGSLNVYGPVSGYPDSIVLLPVNGKPIDPSWDNKNNSIRGTVGGFLVAGKVSGTPGGGTPGKLSVTGNVSLFGASFAAFASGAAMQGSDYSWLASDGAVSLGGSKLDLSLIGYTPHPGDSLTIITAAKGITGKFSQGDSITVNSFTFHITYNANSVVLKLVFTRLLGLQPARVGAGYSSATETGGVGADHFSIVAGSLPPGITLDPNTGQLSGVPQRPGSYAFSVHVTDSNPGGVDSATEAFTLAVAQGDVARLVLLSQPAVAPVNGWIRPFLLLVFDKYGNPLSGVTVQLSPVLPLGLPPAGFSPGSVLQATTVDGVATFGRVALYSRGLYRLTVRVGGQNLLSDRFVIGLPGPVFVIEI
jgi:hypothetical protein